MAITTQNSSTWTLKHQFLISQMDRIDHPDYFSPTFTCPDIDTFIPQILTPQDLLSNRPILIIFFDRILSLPHPQKSIYVRLKWLIYLHKLIQLFKPHSILYLITVKVLQKYSQKFDQIFKTLTPFEQYLLKFLFKPYLQYLLKLTMLAPSPKQHINYIPYQDFSLQQSQLSTQLSEPSFNKQQGYPNWFRNYNLIISTIQGFGKKLKQFEPFFTSQLPFLSNLRSLITHDLQLKYQYIKSQPISLSQLSMTSLELDSLQNKLDMFSRKSEKNLFEQAESTYKFSLKDYTKQDADSFMISPLKPNARSLQSTLSFFNDE